MKAKIACLGICLWLACCFGQAADEWKTWEWKRIRSQRLNGCPTSITIQRMAAYKDRDIYWVSVSIIAPKSNTTIKYADIQFTALDEMGVQMDANASDPQNEKKPDYDKGLDTERLGFYDIPFGKRKLERVMNFSEGGSLA